MERLGRRRIQPDQLAKRGDGCIVLSGLESGSGLAHQLAGGFQFALFLDLGARLLELGSAFRLLSSAREGQAELVSRGAKLGIELHRLAEMRNGVGQGVSLKQDLTHLEVRGAETGLEVDRFLELCNRLVDAVYGALGVGERQIV